jgi:6,7-dimethyl-8-ribityllumazine synthase
LTVRLPRRLAPAFSPKEREASLDARKLRVAVVCSRWNPTVTDALLASALETLSRHGARASRIEVIRVPGAFELPVATRALLRARRFDAIVLLGAIVRGETPHHEVLGHAVASALAGLSAQAGVPLGFGLLTCDTMEQARRRTSKGAEAAEAAVEMANLTRSLRGR